MSGAGKTNCHPHSEGAVGYGMPVGHGSYRSAVDQLTPCLRLAFGPASDRLAGSRWAAWRPFFAGMVKGVPSDAEDAPEDP